MFNVSRTTVPPSWFATPIPKSKSTPRITVSEASVVFEYLSELDSIQSQISVSTINTDLFPELITWAAVIEDHSPACCSQKVPIDVLSKREHDIDTVNETTVHSLSELALVLDPTSLEFGFDRSCLDGLDDCLAYSPVEAFKETCWTQCTHSRPVRDTVAKSPRRSSTPRPKRRAEPRSPLAASGASDDDSDTDSDDTTTLTDDDDQLDSADDNGLSDSYPTGGFLTYVSFLLLLAR